MFTARCAYPAEQLEPADHSFCWAEPCARCREVKAALRLVMDERSAETYRSMWMDRPLRKSDLKVLHDATV